MATDPNKRSVSDEEWAAVNEIPAVAGPASGGTTAVQRALVLVGVVTVVAFG